MKAVSLTMLRLLVFVVGNEVDDVVEFELFGVVTVCRCR